MEHALTIGAATSGFIVSAWMTYRVSRQFDEREGSR